MGRESFAGRESFYSGTAVEELGDRLFELTTTLAGNFITGHKPKRPDAHAAVYRILKAADRHTETAKNIVALVYGLRRNSIDRMDSLLEVYAKSFLTDNHNLVAEASLIWRE
jgi:hypothetical protein